MPKQFAALDDIAVESRHRKTFSEKSNQDLQESIRTVGLLHAIVLEETDYGLVLRAGERRLRAVRDLAEFGQTIAYNGEAVELGMIPYSSWEALTDLQRLQIEVDENQQREAFTWQESATALSQLEKLRTIQAGLAGLKPPTTKELAIEAYSSGADPMHPTAAAAKAKDELILAKHLHKPEIAKAKTAKEAMQILKLAEIREKNLTLANSTDGMVKSSRFQCFNQDSREWVKTCPDGTFDVILTDPPYGMGADNFGTADGGTATAHGYADSEDVLLGIMKWFPEESFRVTKPEAHLYLFCDLDWFFEWKLYLTAAGWKVFRTPLIWVKPTGFRTPWIDSGPQRKYELILYAIKGDKKVNLIAPDVIQLQSAGAGVGHPAAKPVALFSELLRRSVRPADKVLDLFCGTGPIFGAAYQHKCLATGVEMDKAYYGESLKQINLLEG